MLFSYPQPPLPFLGSAWERALSTTSLKSQGNCTALRANVRRVRLCVLYAVALVWRERMRVAGTLVFAVWCRVPWSLAKLSLGPLGSATWLNSAAC